ncbi:heat-inducible transcriptional repressor HrcA [Chloroflexota bacterium]
MLPLRSETILKSIVGQYIARAVPVASQSIVSDYELEVSPATIRNEMARLEHEGYITRPYPSAGSIPLDKGYRYYVESLSDIELPLAEQKLISHLFHQVEEEIEEWLSLTAALIARLVQNMAIVTTPKAVNCHFKHLELVSLQESMALVVLVLHGARVKQQLLTFDEVLSQSVLTAIASKLNTAYDGLPGSQISAKAIDLSAAEQQITNCVVKIMQAEDEQEYEEPYLDGWHFMLSQPEFSHGNQVLPLLELVEQRTLLRTIPFPVPESRGVQVVIGKENKAEAIHNYSVVISRFGLSGEATGAVGVIGPTRMPYARAISIVSYLSSLLSELVSELYGERK